MSPLEIGGATLLVLVCLGMIVDLFGPPPPRNRVTP